MIEKFLNKIFLKDIMELLKEMPDKCVDMVYGDPDYNVGIKYGDKSYTKTFDEYIDWYIDLTKESLRVLKDSGNLFLINYPKQNAYLRVKYLDKVCYEVLDYVWIYNTNVGHSSQRFTTAHRSILHCRKTKDNQFYKDKVALPYQNSSDRRILQNLANGSKGRMPYSWFYFDLVKNVSKEKTFHACQIPQKLSEMLIKAINPA
jgi:DNA modification methylase